ncbi:putative DNA glycosylase [Microlunatus phosphovorus NM-1]|uniref:DNA-(apurinic or apyrimidinic site) lyase n=1 Tax=Microlunatus phosphovorus (strain ATCC 700054 / DSM 10555 / JCM 9379 / NBRC 101784 / NCIMB 13414 / VKM Ac-1990 / NM-1) TaxID=1032480 RepID=F5XK56_MICPN|nr:DNA-formamidopyrimidine glycosylase family protein [Microlunatus phosphovorus]BAK33552.1 putative DNA glycosylase [Microlunatus phosphovorus NM-1]
MPEGDTVWRVCRWLHAVLAGQVLTRAEFRVPKLAGTDLGGATVVNVTSRGKHQLFRFDSGWSLHTHLRMDGAWRTYRPGQRWGGGPEHEVRVLLSTAETDVVGYRLPVVELLRTAEEDQVVGHLGPDLLGPDWDLEEALGRIRARPDRSIGEALLDQRNLAGIGTFYRAEVLFLQGVHPRTPAGDVANLPRVVLRSRQLMQANKERPEQVTTGDLRAGRRAYVFERAGQPCRRCRTPIRTEEFGPAGQERRSYWCPTCQPLSSLSNRAGPAP